MKKIATLILSDFLLNYTDLISNNHFKIQWNSAKKYVSLL